ncbi:DUF4440 domain-containing protein [Bacillus gobiensis]|uniref:nuclear transport factor 2 family protein n=1 Tax=Bacillus gobiensis TaxID=1441095 RepID=UPI003D1CF3C6
MRELEVTLLSLEKQLMHYRIKDFKTILSEDFREFGTSGKVYDKTKQLSFVNDEGIAGIPFIITNFNAKLLSQNIAHVTYQTESKSNGSKSLRSSIWRYENKQWCLYFHQGTPTI